LPAALGPSAQAHDTWVEAGPLYATTGEYVYVNLMLGNHGNEHRDFKLASKITLAPCKLVVTAPDGQVTDLKPAVLDMGSAAKEGYWTARYDLQQAGLHEVVHTLDTLHGTIRAIKSAKTYVLARPADGPQSVDATELPKSYGHGLELLLHTPPSQLSAGHNAQVQVLRNGKPLPAARVTFVPRGQQLSEGFDEQYERTSNEQGLVDFTPQQGNVILVIAHHAVPEESGDGYDKTHYSAALVLPIPNHASSR